MLRPALALLAVAALAAPVLFNFATASEGEGSPASLSAAPPIPYTSIQLDGSLLPGPTGWFAVPVTVDQPAYVRIDIELDAFQDGATTLAHSIIAVEGRESLPFMVLGMPGEQATFQVAHDGNALVECCAGVQTSWSSASADANIPLLLSPGEVLWVGLATYQWNEWHHFLIELSAQANLAVGNARTGLTVEAVDLYEEARVAGTSARLLAYEVSATPGRAERAWQAEHVGLFSLVAHTWADEANARLQVEVPGEAPHEVRLSADAPLYAVAHRAGAYRVALDDIRAPPVRQGPLMQAYAIFADIDVPGDVAFIYP